MAKPMKHVGKVKSTGSKVLVVFRTLPGESDQALVLPVHQLPDAYHDSLIQLVETDQAQESFELGEIMFIRSFPDGRPMLNAMQQDNRLQKVPTSNIIMNPTPTDEIVLSELNGIIAQQKNCTVDELYTFVKGAPSKDDVSPEAQQDANVVEDVAAPAPSESGVLDDEALAKSYRSQADTLYKEAARLRREADELDPPKKKTTTKKKTEEA